MGNRLQPRVPSTKNTSESITKFDFTQINNNRRLRCSSAHLYNASATSIPGQMTTKSATYTVQSALQTAKSIEETGGGGGTHLTDAIRANPGEVPILPVALQAAGKVQIQAVKWLGGGATDGTPLGKLEGRDLGGVGGSRLLPRKPLVGRGWLDVG